MVSVLKAPRPSDFRPTIWPANWQLWREDKFGTPSTVYDPDLWVRMTTEPYDAANIVPCPDGGIRFIAQYVDDGLGNAVPKGAEIFSGPQHTWGRVDEHGRSSRHVQAQVYSPPFMMRVIARYSNPSDRPFGIQGTWLLQSFTPLSDYGITSVPDPGIAPGIEMDGDEYSSNWPSLSMPLHARTNPHTPPFSNVTNLSNSIPAAQLVDQWYELVYLVHRDHNGHLRCHQAINGITNTHLLHEIYSAEWFEYINAGFEIPFMVLMGNSGTPSSWGSFNTDLGTITPPTPEHYYDVRRFEVFVPPDDPRLLQPFRSNVPGSSAPPFWEIAGSIVGSTLNVAITDGQPGANWSVSVTEDAPDPSPPVIADGQIVWVAGTKTYVTPGIDVSGFNPAKDLSVTVTHGGRPQSIIVSR